MQSLSADGSQDFASPAGDGISNLTKYAFNLAPNAGDLTKPNSTILPTNGTAGLPAIQLDANGRINITFVRRKASTYPGVAYVVQTCADLGSWKELSLTNAIVTSIDVTWERVSVTDPTVSARRFGRVLLAEAANNYNYSLGNPFRGSAVQQGQAFQLTQNVGGQQSAAVCNGITLNSATEGFSASLNLTVTSTNGPADGVSFAVGELGSGTWGEAGPGTTRSLAVGFDTYWLFDANDPSSKGIHLWLNGVAVAYAAVDPFNNGATAPVTISYDPVSGMTVTYNGAAVFTNVPISGFDLGTDDQFGLGGRTDSPVESAVVDTLMIAPR